MAVTTATARASPAGSRACFTRARYERSPGLGVTRRCTYQVESSALADWHEGVIWPACRRARGADWSRRGRAGCPAGYQAARAPARGLGLCPARGWPAGGGAGARAGPGLRLGWVGQDCPAGRLGPVRAAAGGLAVVGCCGQRSGAVLAPRGRGGGPGMPRDWRAARSVAGPTRAVLVRWGGRRPAGRTGPSPSVPLSCLARLVQAFDGKRAMPGSRRSAASAVPGLSARS